MSDYFKKTPISEPPQNATDHITDLGTCTYYSMGKCWFKGGETVFPKWWLRPSAPPDEGEFAEWCVEKYKFLKVSKRWMPIGVVPVTKTYATSELLQLFRQKGGEG